MKGRRTLMDMKRLFAMQKELNNRIVREHGLEHADLLEKRRLAFLVELGELANETRCFKYWSKRPASSRETILEEYVDGLHFVLSIGLDVDIAHMGLAEEGRLEREADKLELTRLFLSLYRWGSQEHFSQEEFYCFAEEFLKLGVMLGFQYTEVEDAYLKKNLVNHERQNTGY
jgi:dimeric dUTPase (all-alpha-NTP-PPase superfamily)